MTEIKLNQILRGLLITVVIICVVLFLVDIIFNIHWLVLVAIGVAGIYFIVGISIVHHYFKEPK